MKIHDHFFIFLRQNNRRPDGVNKHQEDGKQTWKSMHVIGQSASHFEHHTRPHGIADQAKPKENRVPDFEPALDPLTPDTDGVENQGKIDYNNMEESGRGKLSPVKLGFCEIIHAHRLW